MKFSKRTLAIVLALVLICGVTAIAATPARLLFQNSAGTVVRFEIEDFLGNPDLEGPFAQWLTAGSEVGGNVYIGDADGKAVPYVAGTSLQDQINAKEDVSGTALAGVTIYKAVAFRDGKLIISVVGEDGEDAFFEIETPDAEPVPTEYDPDEEPGPGPSIKFTVLAFDTTLVPGYVVVTVTIDGDSADNYIVKYDGEDMEYKAAGRYQLSVPRLTNESTEPAEYDVHTAKVTVVEKPIGGGVKADGYKVLAFDTTLVPGYVVVTVTIDGDSADNYIVKYAGEDMEYKAAGRYQLSVPRLTNESTEPAEYNVHTANVTVYYK